MVYDPLDDAIREVEDYPEDEEGIYQRAFASPGSALRAASKRNPRNLPCPTCGAKNRLTPADRANHYQCDECAARAEGTYMGADY